MVILKGVFLKYGFSKPARFNHSVFKGSGFVSRNYNGKYRLFGEEKLLNETLKTWILKKCNTLKIKKTPFKSNIMWLFSLE